MRRLQCILIITLLMADCAFGATITVRKDGTGDFMVIQQALDIAAAGDTVLIGPGEYLEHSAVRFPGWSWDIESYANVTVDNVTIIGAGSNETFIGPLTYSGNYSTETPKVVTYLGGGGISLADVCLRNSHSGVYMRGRLYMDRCELSNNYINVGWGAIGSGGWIRDSQFDVTTPNYPISIDITTGSGAADILIENCTVQHSLVLIDGVDGVVIRDCVIRDYVGALQMYGAATVDLERCQLTNISSVGIHMTGAGAATCRIEDSVVSGNQRALYQEQAGGQFHVTASRLEGGSVAIVTTHGASGACSIHNCDLIVGSGVAVRCYMGTSAIQHDFSNNYWGTTDEQTIQSWITDHNDDPNIGATVLYRPFAGQSVPTESTSWGDLKALFR
jgi:hypothetical protein